MILSRRTALTALPLGLLLPAAKSARADTAQPPGVPASGALAFSVWRKGSRIGDHQVSFKTDGSTLTVTSTAHFSIGFGPISFYSYHYQATEVWQDGVLQSLDATANNNGDRGFCTVRRNGDALSVTGSKTAQYMAPKGSIAGTHWNKAELDAPMINPEDGRLMTFTVTQKGSDAGPGSATPSAHYALTGFATLDLWYSETGQWAALRALAKDGSSIEYHAEGAGAADRTAGNTPPPAAP